VIDRLMTFFREFSGNQLRSHRYLKGLSGFISHYDPDLASHFKSEPESQGKIILPAAFRERSYGR
jgi:hypothetical protein